MRMRNGAAPVAYGAAGAVDVWASFVDHGNSEFWTAVTYNVINRLLPELATKRLTGP